MLDEIKTALGISASTTTYNSEITSLIAAAVIDLNISGVDSDAVSSSSTDSMVKLAITIFVCYQFNVIHGNLQRAESLKKTYDTLKGELGMSTGYTTGGEFDESEDEDES